MKIIGLMVVLGILWGGGSVFAESSGSVKTSARLTQVIGSVSIGNDTGVEAPGYAAVFRSFSFLDPEQPSLFWGWGVGALSRQIAGNPIPDVSPLILGWLGRPHPAIPLELTLSTGFTVGSRFQGPTILGSLYTGIGGSIGVHFLVSDEHSFGISIDPVLALATWGAPQALNRSYVDVGFCWSFRSLEETKGLAWATKR